MSDKSTPPSGSPRAHKRAITNDDEAWGKAADISRSGGSDDDGWQAEASKASLPVFDAERIQAAVAGEAPSDASQTDADSDSDSTMAATGDAAAPKTAATRETATATGETGAPETNAEPPAPAKADSEPADAATTAEPPAPAADKTERSDTDERAPAERATVLVNAEIVAREAQAAAAEASPEPSGGAASDSDAASDHSDRGDSGGKGAAPRAVERRRNKARKRERRASKRAATARSEDAAPVSSAAPAAPVTRPADVRTDADSVAIPGANATPAPAEPVSEATAPLAAASDRPSEIASMAAAATTPPAPASDPTVSAVQRPPATATATNANTNADATNTAHADEITAAPDGESVATDDALRAAAGVKAAAKPTRKRGLRRTLLAALVLALAGGGVAGALVSERNSERYYVICRDAGLTAARGRYLPWRATTQLEGGAWRPLAGVPCAPRSFDSNAALAAHLWNLLVVEIDAWATDPNPANSAAPPPAAEDEPAALASEAAQAARARVRAQLEQARLLVPEFADASAAAEHLRRLEHLQGDLAYWEARYDIEAAAHLIEEAAGHLQAASVHVPLHHAASAARWQQVTERVQRAFAPAIASSAPPPSSPASPTPPGPSGEARIPDALARLPGAPEPAPAVPAASALAGEATPGETEPGAETQPPAPAVPGVAVPGAGAADANSDRDGADAARRSGSDRPVPRGGNLI